MENDEIAKNKSLLPIWSNAPFLVPAFAASQKGLFAYALLIIITALVSFWRQRTASENVGFINQVITLGLVSTNLYVLYLSGWRQPYFAIAILFGLIALYFYFKSSKSKSNAHHGFWLLALVAFTLMCVLAY